MLQSCTSAYKDKHTYGYPKINKNRQECLLGDDGPTKYYRQSISRTADDAEKDSEKYVYTVYPTNARDYQAADSVSANVQQGGMKRIAEAVEKPKMMLDDDSIPF